MSEIKEYEQLELDFTEGEKEMEKENNVVEAEFKEVEESGEKVQAQIVISLLSDGRLDVNVPEGMPELKPADVEELTRRVHDQLRDMRIAQNAIEIFKARLG